MSVQKFISTVWSETLYSELERRCVGAGNCWRGFEGEIKKQGDRVRICGIDPITVFDYVKNSDFGSVQELNATSRDLVIDQAKAFNFQIDDVDRTQSSPDLMRLAMGEAARALAEAADDYVYSIWESAPSSQVITADDVDAESVIDVMLAAKEKLSENNVGSGEEVSLEVSPAVATVILKARILSGTDNAPDLNTGAVGDFLGMKLYVSGGVASETENGKKYYKCLARTKRAVAFASQLSEVEAYRPEKRFADAVKGLHLYGAKLVYPKEIVVLNVSVK